MPLAPSPPFKPAQPVEAKKGKPVSATIHELPLPAPEPVPASGLVYLAEENLRYWGIPVSWMRTRWPAMADVMERQAPVIASHTLRCAKAVRRASQ